MSLICNNGHHTIIYPNEHGNNKELHDEILGCGLVGEMDTSTPSITEVSEYKFFNEEICKGDLSKFNKSYMFQRKQEHRKRKRIAE